MLLLVAGHRLRCALPPPALVRGATHGEPLRRSALRRQPHRPPSRTTRVRGALARPRCPDPRGVERAGVCARRTGRRSVAGLAEFPWDSSNRAPAHYGAT